ncbi:thermonuclease family protein [Halalkalibacter alkalisediminis]|uniref:Thermonuclease family protein n=1 Tax=Halalkalibacter alkalisediminis TaxID=935616 RepID=A0ABV6NJN0_9BACI|nr:thermonuclease family protein [Halalkalibacter alkalisediminis]
MKLTYIVILLVIIMSACAPAEQSLPKGSEIEAFEVENPAYLEGEWLVAQVDRVVDGDTIVISQLNLDQVGNSDIVWELAERESAVRVRFLAVDTPENTKEKQKFGQESTDLVKDLLEGNEVIIELDPKALFDNYDRLLGHVFTVEGANVQQVLLRNGLARVAYLFDDYKYVDDYLDAEEAARSEQLHIHSIEGYVTERGFNMDVVDK